MILALKNISAYYRDPHYPIIKDISICVDAGEIVALLGPNGSGKSTILKSIFGLAHVSSGKISFKDEIITGLPSQDVAKKGIGYVYQGRRLFPGLTVMENLKMGAYTRRDPKEIKSDLDQVLEMFDDLKPLVNKRACYLSGGEQQMVAFARALMLRPSVLLLDEPSIGLSPLAAEKVFTYIRQIRERGIAILLVEQQVEMALQVSDRVCVMRNGEIVREDRSENLRDMTNFKNLFFGG